MRTFVKFELLSEIFTLRLKKIHLKKGFLTEIISESFKYSEERIAWDCCLNSGVVYICKCTF